MNDEFVEGSEDENLSPVPYEVHEALRERALTLRSA